MRITINKIFSAGLFYLMFSTQAWSTNYLMFIGAGGEKAKKDTIFDVAIKNLGDYVKRSPGMKVDVALNGGHPTTEALIQQSFPTASSKSHFFTSDYNRLIDEYIRKLEKNEMGEGDQFMIYIDGHGAKGNKDTATHQIATAEGALTNLTTLEGSTLVDLTKLIKLRGLTKKKKVKMAIIDNSCHSGSTLALADDNTCVISATGPNHYSYLYFSQNFAAAMRKGRNLEEIYLQVRVTDETPSLPMISTYPGQAVSSILYDKMTPFLYHIEGNSDQLSPYLQENSSDYHQCVADKNYASLINTINAVEELNTISKKTLWSTTKIKELDLGNLKTLLEKYKKSLDLLTSKMRKIGINRLKKIEPFHVITLKGKLQASLDKDYSWRELLTTDFNKLISNIQERINGETNDSTLFSHEALKIFYLQAQAKKEEILKTQPGLASILVEEDKIKKLVDINYHTANDIATEERKLYSALYKNAQKTQPAKQPNPCRDFKL